ncbi:MAG TPA: hypothetical protein VKV15_13635, partial [Bryobacteraceae bacterium]|nr:hypothetical protein [Bryobacteraceae bacterium]
LISLRYRGQEMLYGQSAGASVSMFATRRGPEAELKHLQPYWSAFNPDQGASSMGIPATVTGVACHGQQSMRAFAMMIDRGANNSFQKEPLLGVWQGRISDHFPPGYSSPFAIETNAAWLENPGKSPHYYLRLDQSVVHVRPSPTGALEWFLSGAAPWEFANYAAYPDNCTDKTPCAGNTARALAAGYYKDAARTTGLATVIPLQSWQTPKAYNLPNAEYVVLLYGAVWAAPRRVFATVLERPLNGVGAFRFTWYVCVGSWEHARSFAVQQPPPDRELRPPSASAAVPPPDDAAVRVACEVTNFKMQPEHADQAVVLRDPAGEQIALFDIAEGGALVSLKYRGIEHIWGHNGGGLLQMAFHHAANHGAWKGDYNPTQAGDGSAMSPVTGVACQGTSAVTILTMMLDFNHNNSFYTKPLIAVWGGHINDMIPLSYFSPYTLETHASWIPNPKGEPKFYLKLEEQWTHIADEKIGPFAFDFAAYVPWEFKVRAVSPENCPCSSSATKYMAGGWYINEERRTGLAIAMPSNNFHSGSVRGEFNSDYMWRNRSFHLSAGEALDGISSKSFVWYVLAGTWQNAADFARTLPGK